MKILKTQKRVLIILVMAGISCTEEINIQLNTPENQRVVVEGRITNQLTNQIVRLSRTLSYFDDQRAPAVLGAEVYIVEEGTGIRYDLTLVNDTMGYYQTGPVQGRVGQTYSLHVVDGDDSYEASAYLDTVAQMDSINYIYKYNTSMWGKQGFYIVRMSAFEPPPLGNIYMFYLYLNDSLYTDRLVEVVYTDDLLFNNAYIANAEIIYIPQEAITRDTNDVKVVMFSISKEEFEYNNTFLQESYNSGSIFSGPPANVPSNFKNTSGGLDGLGFFGASSVTSKDMVLIKEHNDSTNNPDYTPW
jgi:hypothetical protein